MTDRDVAGWSSATAPDWVPPNVDLKTNVPHSARIYDYILGGKDNFPADRAAAEQLVRTLPTLPVSMRENRRFLARMARVMAEEYGIRQFLDIGTGLPTAPNLHEVAQGVAPESRILYVDNDPIVLVHARALLTSTPEGRTAYLDANFTDPASILNSEQFASTFDLTKPVAVSLLAIVLFIPDDDVVRNVIDTLMAPLPAGSMLAITTNTADHNAEEVEAAVAAYNANGIPMKARPKAVVENFFEGTELIEPGVTLIHQWRPDGGAPTAEDSQVNVYGGIARKP